MNKNLMLTGVLALTLAGTGCATKKYVAKTMAPVQDRVTASEGKIADQGKQIATQGQEIDQLQTSLSRTNERVTDADTKATNAGAAAQRANEAAGAAQRSADGANTAAGNAMTAANSSMNRANEVDRNVTALGSKVDQTVKLTQKGSETVLFKTNQYTLDKDAKAALDAFAAKVKGNDRYAVEVQGFTDKTGSAEANEVLSQKRAESVARYLVNEHKLPLHQVEVLGSGYAAPVGDDKTRDGRKQNRRVEVRLFAPEIATVAGR